MNLEDLTVLAIDCQATGSSPEHAELIELGWSPFRASSSTDPDGLTPEARLIQPETSTSVPRRVRELTGIDQQMLNDGDPLSDVETTFLNHAEKTDRILAHYARYEQRFLKAETALRHPERYHQQQFLCTHEIATRLYPDLPRRGLRAMAGYFGYTVPEDKRVVHHIRATAYIWQHLVDVLRETEGVESLKELESWLEQTSGERSGEGYTYPISRERRLSLPEKPGTYHMIDREQRVLYVGKATSLKSRVNSYFQSGKQLSNRKLELVSRVQDVECHPTTTALEAALQENDEIKELDPAYNKALTPGSRSIVFVDHTFRDTSSKKTETHPIGPFSRPHRMEVFGTLLAFIRGQSPSGALPQDPRFSSLVSEPAFRNGLDQFRSRHHLSERRDEEIPPTLLLSLGQTLWWQRQRRNESDTEEVDHNDSSSTPEHHLGDTEHPPTESSEQMTPEQVADRIESYLRRGARNVRRARWYEELSSCSICWSPPVLGGSWRTLTFDQGHIVNRRTTPSATKPPAPPVTDGEAFRKPTVKVFDRLRVLTTGLKRLDEKQIPLYLRTTYGSTATRSDIASILWWM